MLQFMEVRQSKSKQKKVSGIKPYSYNTCYFLIYFYFLVLLEFVFENHNLIPWPVTLMVVQKKLLPNKELLLTAVKKA